MRQELMVTVEGQERLLRWDLRAILETEEQGYGGERLLSEIKGDKPMRARLVMCAAMLNSGARYTGEPFAQETADSLADKLTEAETQQIMRRMTIAYLAATRREHAQDSDDAVVDVVLENLQKKRGSVTTQKEESGGS